MSKTAALGFQLVFAQKSIRLRFKRLHVNHLRGEPGLERRKLHDIRQKFLGCLTYEMF